jgi:penicillin-binding protein 1C
MDRSGRKWLAWAAVPAAMVVVPALAAAAWLWPLAPPSFQSVRTGYVPSEAYLLDRHGVLLATRRLEFGVRRFAWTPLADVSPALADAIVQGEDRRFAQHHGVDWRAAAGAARDTLLHGRRRGASTLTMQLASLLQAPQALAAQGGPKDWSAKRAQVRFALGLERRWSKAQILEAYLNLVQFRGELQGIGAASQLLARHAPAGLDAAEGKVLAALLPSPNAAPERVTRRACARDREADCTLLRATAQRLLAAPAAGADANAPGSSDTAMLAPHVARLLLQRPGERLRSTLDAGIQRVAQESLARQLALIADHEVRDGAALVVDNDSGEVLAYVGSAGPASRAPQVDGVRAPRQAGSTLKPFLYEQAIEQRLLTAASILDDVPVNIDTASGIYLPQDYDHDYKGAVSVRTALGSSLNVPAVRALMLVGVEPFRQRLQALGYAGITEEGSWYGYSLALGSAEVTLWEQAQAYRALARGGQPGALRLRLDEHAAPAGRLLGQAASFVVGDMLSDRAARIATFGLGGSLSTAYWSAVKTGTSKDMRDNWCVGYTQRYTVAVWVGNFEGGPMHNVSGVTGAAPAWREIMDALQAPSAEPGPKAPLGAEAHAIRYAAGIEAPRHEWFLAGTVPRGEITPVAREARRARIHSPANGMVLAIDPDIPERLQRVPLTVQGGEGGQSLQLDGADLGPAANTLLWAPSRGAHRLNLVAADGQVLDRILFTVR